MFELKPLRKDAVPAAIRKADHYRLLNEPRLAESICLDVLAIDPKNQEALVMLVLSLSDQLDKRQNAGVKQARQYLAEITDEYCREYYDGLLCERRGRAVLRRGQPNYQHYAYNWFAEALEHYGRAEGIRPPDNDDVILRWNTVVRILENNPELQPEPDEPWREQMLE